MMNGMHQGMGYMNQGTNMGANAMNQGMYMGTDAMNQGMGYMNHTYNHMGNAAMYNNANMSAMPGMGSGSGFESFLSTLASFAIPLLFWVLLIAGSVFLAKGLWEMYKTHKEKTTSVTVAKPVEVME